MVVGPVPVSLADQSAVGLQVQQLMSGRLLAEARVGEMTALVDGLRVDNEQLRRRLRPDHTQHRWVALAATSLFFFLRDRSIVSVNGND